ncbi:iron chaperone [Aureibacillus halotolerans]|uniref:YdhG-like domain-containing protein n=1 Tax=Aureibacillus halotolerans TaxID=1508390 RepID=A0A4R6TQZ4_9BACI|nr:iron chaperone [Aureibacillus halotolerans]TDQ34640.1 hypothetical protein EV213_12458 [Aureibacillus halotolerans]
MEEFKEYLAGVDHPDQRERMEELFAWVSTTFPQLERRVAWNQPMFTDHGTFIIGFSMANHHMSVAPEQVVIDHFSDDIVQAGYDHTKQLLRIKWKLPLDYSLLEQIIAFNIKDKADCTTFWRK